MMKTLALFLAVITLAAAAANHKSALRASSALSSGASQSVITVLGASFGLKDVTSEVQALIGCNVPVSAEDAVLGDGWPGVVKTLSIAYQVRGGSPQIAVVKEHGSITINCFQVYAANFGPANVTSLVQSKVSNNALTVLSANSVFTDSWPGTQKALTVFYSTGAGVNTVAIAQEGVTLNLS